MNPGNPSPMMTPPPPAPPSKGGFPWKWVLIGCGSITFLALIVCGGCSLFAYYAGKDLMAAVEALQNHPKIEAEIGTYAMVAGAQSQVQNSDQSITQTLQVKGERGSGKVTMTYKFESMKIKVINKTFTNEKTGATISLD